MVNHYPVFCQPNQNKAELPKLKPCYFGSNLSTNGVCVCVCGTQDVSRISSVRCRGVQIRDRFPLNPPERFMTGQKKVLQKRDRERERETWLQARKFD